MLIEHVVCYYFHIMMNTSSGLTGKEARRYMNAYMLSRRAEAG